MHPVTRKILKAFYDLKFTCNNSLDKDLIKNKVKTQLDTEELKNFNYTAKRYNEGYFLMTEEKKVISKIELTKKGYELIYQYNAYQTETKIIDHIVNQFYSINKNRKQKNPDSISTYMLINSISLILNPKQIEDGCISSAFNALILDDAIYIKNGEVRLTKFSFDLLYP